MKYEEFIREKSQIHNNGGFDPVFMPEFLFDFQKHLVEWAVRKISHKCAREEADEKHICPLQLDVIERAITLWSNAGETVLTPFLGVGSEAYGALINGRRAIGFELKETYYRQAVRNLEMGCQGLEPTEESLFNESNFD